MSFDILAPYYRWMERILAGEKLHRCRTQFLDKIIAPQNILLLGEGHGRALDECCRRFPEARVTCVDSSEKMLAQARRRLPQDKNERGRAKFIRANILNWSPPAKNFDLVVTNFFLDCFPPDDLMRIISNISEHTSESANWLVADFQMAVDGWKRARSKLILATMYFFFRVITKLPARSLTNPDPFLHQAGFALRARKESEWGLLHSDWWSR